MTVFAFAPCYPFFLLYLCFPPKYRDEQGVGGELSSTQLSQCTHRIASIQHYIQEEGETYLLGIEGALHAIATIGMFMPDFTLSAAAHIIIKISSNRKQHWSHDTDQETEAPQCSVIYLMSQSIKQQNSASSSYVYTVPLSLLPL